MTIKNIISEDGVALGAMGKPSEGNLFDLHNQYMADVDGNLEDSGNKRQKMDGEMEMVGDDLKLAVETEVQM